MRTLFRYIHDPRWPRQHRWRQRLWQVMGNMGLTGIHSWPMHRNWVEFAHFPMYLQNLPADLRGLKVVQISDLHYSPVVWRTYLEQYVEWINELKPAVVTATGDLYMGGRRFAVGVADLLAKVKATRGVVSILGNHDYGISGKAGSVRGPQRAAYLQEALEDRGLIMLRNQTWALKSKTGPSLQFVGLDEHWAGRMRPEEAFAGLSPDDPVICLVHNPAYCMPLMTYPWQWMLTGHTHGRQLATSPLGQRLYPSKYRHFTRGLYRVNGRYLYVNRGLSYGQRSREWCRPEITVFELVDAQEAPV